MRCGMPKLGSSLRQARRAVNQSAVSALADASEITGLPRDNFEVHETTKEEFEGLVSEETPLIPTVALRPISPAAPRLPRPRFKFLSVPRSEIERYTVDHSCLS
jgi:hypothetical protein